MGTEGKGGKGSMYGAADSLRNLSEAVDELLEYLPENFLWPSELQAGPKKAGALWRHGSIGGNPDAVWIIAIPSSVSMDTNMLPEEQQGLRPFKARLCAEWLLKAAEKWQWDEVTGTLGRPVGVAIWAETPAEPEGAPQARRKRNAGS